jgi:4-oxalocrotonate tautomerase
MPVIEITFFEGRPIEKKRELVKAVTDAMSRTMDLPPEGIHVILKEVKKDQWAVGGVLRSDKPAAKS